MNENFMWCLLLVFIIYWRRQSLIVHLPLLQKILDSGPVPYARYNSITFVAEQVSHHPPSEHAHSSSGSVWNWSQWCILFVYSIWFLLWESINGVLHQCLHPSKDKIPGVLCRCLQHRNKWDLSMTFCMSHWSSFIIPLCFWLIVHLHLLNFGEEYVLTTPNVYARYVVCLLCDNNINFLVKLLYVLY